MKKTLIALFVIITAVIAGKKEGYQQVNLSLPSGPVYLTGYSYDLTGSKIYGTDTPVSFTDKYLAVWIADITAAVSVTDKWYTNDPAESWTVYRFEINKGVNEDDAWISFEIGL